MTTPTERDLSYRERQRAAAASTRGAWAHLNGRATPGMMPRRMRRGLGAIVRGNHSLGVMTKAAARLLNVDPVEARRWLVAYPMPAKVTQRVRAFNAPIAWQPDRGFNLSDHAYDVMVQVNREGRNAAKAQRRARRGVQ